MLLREMRRHSYNPTAEGVGKVFPAPCSLLPLPSYGLKSEDTYQIRQELTMIESFEQ